MAKVLSVDDSKIVRTLVAKHLQSYGCQVVEAANGRDGVEAAQRERPDLVLLDVTMPVMDGKQALGELRRHAETRHTPVVMLTGESGPEAEDGELEVSGYLVKPFSRDTFERAVGKVLGRPKAPSAHATGR